MIPRPIRVLLVDGQVEDSRWVQELLAEFDEHRYECGWMHGLEVFHLERLETAMNLLSATGADDRYDVVLLNPALPDSFGLPTFLKLQACAPQVPVVILSELDDPDLAVSLIRAGAQDYLPKSQLDCAPLARTLRLVVERNRTLLALRTLSWRDPLTGLHNEPAFCTLLDRDLAVARKLGHNCAVAAIEVGGLDELVHTYGKEEQQPAILEAAELLRDCCDGTTSTAFLPPNRFAIAHPGAHPVETRRWLYVVQKRFHRFYSMNCNRACLHLRYGVAFQQPGASTGASALIAAAMDSLCENVGGVQPDLLEKNGHLATIGLSHSARRNL